jgi:hypothetical protein
MAMKSAVSGTAAAAAYRRIVRHVCVSLGCLTVVLTCSSADAQDRRGTRFWNLTANTVNQFYLSPAGRDTWGPNQCKNDKDGEVDHNERLRITGVQNGRYDARLHDERGRVCVVRDLEIKEGAIFSIEEKDLKDCTTR